MALTTFTGPVKSLNGFIDGTPTSPITVTTAQNINASYGKTTATTGDTRLVYDKLTFASTGSGETIRAFSVVTAAGAAAAGTINGIHASMETAGGTISGAANAIRATLGGSTVSPGGTLAVVQLDTNFTANVSLPGNASFLRVSDSGTNTGEVPNLLNIEAGPAATLVASGGSGALSGTIKKIKMMIDGVTYYLPAATVIS